MFLQNGKRRRPYQGCWFLQKKNKFNHKCDWLKRKKFINVVCEEKLFKTFEIIDYTWYWFVRKRF